MMKTSTPASVIGRRSFVAAAVASLTVGCSGGCPTLEECDIREASCQRKTADVAACLRGGDSPSPPVFVVDANAFIDEQVKNATANPETQDERDIRTGLALFGLAARDADPSSTVRDYWSDVAAFYSAETGKVTILDRGTPLDGPGAVALLTHELIHAMQHHDLGTGYYERLRTTYDASLALTGIVEGEATLYEDLARAYGYARDPGDVAWDYIFQEFERREGDLALGDGSPYEMAEIRFPYAFGGAYLNRAWRSGGGSAVRGVFEHAPVSARQVLGGFGAHMPQDGWREDPNEVGTPSLSSEFEIVATKHLGAWLFGVFRGIWATSPETGGIARDSGFSGDVLTVFRRAATSDVVGFWRLRFRTADFAAKARSNFVSGSSLGVSQEDRDVVLVASTDDTLPSALAGTVAWTSAPDTDSSTGMPQAGRGSTLNWTCPIARGIR